MRNIQYFAGTLGTGAQHRRRKEQSELKATTASWVLIFLPADFTDFKTKENKTRPAKTASGKKMLDNQYHFLIETSDSNGENYVLQQCKLKIQKKIGSLSGD